MLRVLTALASSGGARGKLSAFIFHRVLAQRDPLMPEEPDAEQFCRILDWISDQFQILEPVEACWRLLKGGLPSRAAIVTFDDGYRDNLQVGLPLLQARRLPAAFFIATKYVDGTAMFNDRIRFALRNCDRNEIALPWLPGSPVTLDTVQAKLEGIARLIAAVKHKSTVDRANCVESIVDAAGADAPSHLMMNALEIQTLARAGMTVGGHTRSHPILSCLTEEEAASEIKGGWSDLADIVGSAPLLFAYPNGRRGADYGDSHIEMVKAAGFQFAFNTHPGVSSRETDRFQLRRFTPWHQDRNRFKIFAMLNLLQDKRVVD